MAGGAGAAVLLGGNGAGKTTLALECLARGATLLADDAVALEPAGSSTLAWPAFPCVRAWRADALRRGLSVADAPPVHPLVDKVRIPVGRGGPFAAARGPRRFFDKGGSHNMFFGTDHPAYWQCWREFVSELGKRPE